MGMRLQVRCEGNLLKLVGSTFLLVAGVLCGLPANAQAQALERATTVNHIFPLPSSRSLSGTELAGKKLFLQVCSTCHLPGLPIFEAYAPILDGKLISTRGEEHVREYVTHGSRRMPGFQYSLQPAEIDSIIAYVKTLVHDPTRQETCSPLSTGVTPQERPC